MRTMGPLSWIVGRILSVVDLGQRVVIAQVTECQDITNAYDFLLCNSENSFIITLR